jgi:hypothetical protein
MGVLPGNLTADDEVGPAVHELWGFSEKRKLRSKGVECLRGRGDGPAEPIRGFRSSGDDPKLDQDLSTDEYGLLAGNQMFHGGFRDHVLVALLVGESKEHVRIDQASHQS